MIRMLHDVGEMDARPDHLAQDVKRGYLTFCQRHPGFDDGAVERAGGQKKILTANHTNRTNEQPGEMSLTHSES